MQLSCTSVSPRFRRDAGRVPLPCRSGTPSGQHCVYERGYGIHFAPHALETRALPAACWYAIRIGYASSLVRDIYWQKTCGAADATAQQRAPEAQGQGTVCEPSQPPSNYSYQTLFRSKAGIRAKRRLSRKQHFGTDCSRCARNKSKKCGAVCKKGRRSWKSVAGQCAFVWQVAKP